MKHALTLIVATALSVPVLAQHHGHHMPGHAMSAPKAKPKAAPKAVPKPTGRKAAPKPNAKPQAKAPAKAPARKAAPKAARKLNVPARDPHAGHKMPAAPAQKPDPHAGHDMPAAPAQKPDPHSGHGIAKPADPHAGHQMTQSADPHSGHDMGPAQATPPVAPPPAAAFSGPEHAADLLFTPAAMAAAREGIRKEHGEMTTTKLLVDQLETKIRDGRDGYAWDAQGWYGGDIDKFWLKSEGEGEFGHGLEKAEIQALWSRAIDPWFDLQAGLRHDFKPDPQRTYFVLGVQGLAPYWFEVDAAVFVSNKGDISARFEAEYDLRLTQKLILQPRVEFDLALQDVPEIGIGSGLSSGEIGARLRYEIRPEFAPYIGVEYERAFGDTARFRTAGEGAGAFRMLVGFRTWF
jgi:copper resistance protein B